MREFLLNCTDDGDAIMGLDRYFHTITRDEPEAIELMQETITISVLILNAYKEYDGTKYCIFPQGKLVTNLEKVTVGSDSYFAKW